jgi:RNA polymerase sigma-70 factor (ECF subfamily)
MTNTTSLSLLERLKCPDRQDAWNRFVELYTPLLFYWARSVNLSTTDAADLVQEVLLVVVQKLPEFAYDPSRSFRGWLRIVTLNKYREIRRRSRTHTEANEAMLAELASPDHVPAFDEREYRHQLVAQALRIMQNEFEPTTWKACWEFVVSGRPASEVATELQVSVDVVYGAKSRVLRRLREELAGLLDDGPGE